MAELLLKFATVSALLTIIPGPNAMLVARHALVSRRLAIAAAVGTAVGALTWGIAASVGLATLLHRSTELYEAVKLLGAAYLVYLGAAAIWSTLRRRGEEQHLPTEAQQPQDPADATGGAAAGQPAVATKRKTVAAFRAGFVSDVLNPKTGVFYAAIVPQLLPASYPVFTGTLMFAAVDALVTASWFVLLSVLVGRMSSVLTPKVVRWAERVTGAVLIGLGVRTALERA